MNNSVKQPDFKQLALDIKQWGFELGFQQVGIADTELSLYKERLQAWLDKNYHGEMEYMQKHAQMRANPERLVPGTQRIITIRINYLPESTGTISTLQNKHKGYVSRYALGGDYHKFIRKRLDKLAQKISEEVGPFGYRAFADSAPVMEKALAEKSGLGWIGKNTMLINKQAGSWFFLGTLYTDLPLPTDQPTKEEHCGNCRACLSICPTQAIVAPYQLDARRCISYLTIELKGSIPIELRSLIGNRIYGCDDCNLVCPWNRYAKATDENQFAPRNDLACAELIDLFAWTEDEFLKRTQGSAIRRIGHERWLRNIAIAMGNAPTDPAIVDALRQRLPDASALVREHIEWALAEQTSKPVAAQRNKKLDACEKLNKNY